MIYWLYAEGMSAKFSKIWWYICSIVRKFNHGGGIPFNRPISHRTILGGHRIKTEQACVTLFTSKYGPQKESPLKTLSRNKPNKFKHIQPRFLTPQNPRWRCIAWYWSTCTCLTKTIKVGELLVHDILWGETEIETGTETERWSDSMTILISLTELTFLSKISTGNFSGKPVKVHVFHWCDEWLVGRQELTRDWRVWLTTMRVGRNTQFTVH